MYKSLWRIHRRRSQHRSPLQSIADVKTRKKISYRNNILHETINFIARVKLMLIIYSCDHRGVMPKGMNSS